MHDNESEIVADKLVALTGVLAFADGVIAVAADFDILFPWAVLAAVLVVVEQELLELVFDTRVWLLLQILFSFDLVLLLIFFNLAAAKSDVTVGAVAIVAIVAATAVAAANLRLLLFFFDFELDAAATALDFCCCAISELLLLLLWLLLLHDCTHEVIGTLLAVCKMF
uniref:Uncharacterized protein n=1 Tax=Glossina brevipalpis TaxID=37001 RepID=A0A1A9WY71_9MUSC